MKARLVIAGIAVAILAPGLAGCGGSSGGSSPGKSPADAASSGSNTSSPAPVPTGADGYTPVGTHMSLGQTATVGWNPPFEKGKHPAIRLQVTVKSVDKGPTADFKHVTGMDAADRKATPYYVTVQVKSLADRVYKSDFRPDDPLRVLDSKGEDLVPHSFLGQTGKCGIPTDVPKRFLSGKSYTTCLPFMVPKGDSITGPEWIDGPIPKGEAVTPYLGHPLLWSAG
jgi:hypothetical protein